MTICLDEREVSIIHKKYRRFTLSEVLAIRRDPRTTRAIAKDYAPATHVSIWMVKTGRTWKDKIAETQVVET